LGELAVDGLNVKMGEMGKIGKRKNIESRGGAVPENAPDPLSTLRTLSTAIYRVNSPIL